MEMTKEVCRESSGKRHRKRTMWWWCNEVLQAVKVKKKVYKVWQREQAEGGKRRHREKNIAKKSSSCGEEAGLGRVELE